MLAGNSAWRVRSITRAEGRGQSIDHMSYWTEQLEDEDSVLFVSLASSLKDAQHSLNAC